MFAFNDEIRLKALDYVVDKDIVIKTLTSAGVEQGRNPDVSVASNSAWNKNALTYGALTEPLQLAVEVVSSNWEDDYVDKLDEYERLGIPEYWIVDYLAIASRTYLGYPKVPTVLIYQLIDGKYQMQKFTGSDASGNPSGERIISPTLPQIELTTEQLVAASQIHKI